MKNIEEIRGEGDTVIRETESESERIEREADDCERRIDKLQQDIAAVRAGGDDAVAAALEGSLAGLEAERGELGQEINRQIERLQKLQADIKEVETWNNELGEILGRQAADGVNVAEAEHRRDERAKWAEEQQGRVSELLQRLGRMVT